MTDIKPINLINKMRSFSAVKLIETIINNGNYDDFLNTLKIDVSNKYVIIEVDGDNVMQAMIQNLLFLLQIN